MAGFKVTYKSKLAASTILEVVIAMALIMIIFSIAMLIITNVSHSSVTAEKIKAQEILANVIILDEKRGSATTQTFSKDGYQIEQVVRNYREEADLIEIDLEAYDTGNTKMAELKKIIIRDND